jgi:hypothetical protein
LVLLEPSGEIEIDLNPSNSIRWLAWFDQGSLQQPTESGTNRPDEITDLQFRVLDLQQTLEDPKMFDHRMLRKNYLNICGKTKSS